MKLAETIGIILAIGGLIQFINWILKVVNITEQIGEIVSFFLAGIFTMIIILSILLYETQKEILLIKKEFIKNEEIDNNMNKKGEMIDARILFIVIILILLYLLWKGGVFS